MEVKLVRKSDKKFPAKLRSELIKPPIKRFWYRGTWDAVLFTKCAAVVGSRRMSRYGKQVLSELIPRLVLAGYTIVSGLMYGVDQESHRLALENGGRTIAALGYGITSKNEEGAMSLSEKILESGGLVISEYEGESVSQRWMFLERNRIVVGLADIVVVAEAAEKSGSLDTARKAIKQGKILYSVPGSIFSPTSVGANSLITSGMAKALTLSELNNLVGGKNVQTTNNEIFGKDGSEIAKMLKVTGPMSVNEIARALKLEAGYILSQLLILELKGVVIQERSIWRIC